MNYFFSYEDASRFAKEVDILNADRIPAAEKITLSCVYTIGSDAIKPFFIDGFTDVVPVYAFRQEWDNFKDEPKQSWYLDYTTLALKNIVTGDLYLIQQTKYNSKMFKLSLFYDKLPRLDYFTTELVMPNAVGKPNRKKLENWFEYLGSLHREKLDYINRAKLANKSFAAKVIAKYPDAIVKRNKDGWVSKIHFSYGMLDFTCTANEQGSFSRTYSVNYKLVPKDEVIFA